MAFTWTVPPPAFSHFRQEAATVCKCYSQVRKKVIVFIVVYCWIDVKCGDNSTRKLQGDLINH